jgi:CheY-like chemotaxis protein
MRSKAIDPVSKLDGLRVLVAEDNLVNQMVITAQLRQFGIVPHVVINGEEALAQLGRDDYDVLLLDCNMPVMDGFATARKVREVEQRSGSRLQIIAITANTLPETQAECFDAGMDAFLAKPVDLMRLGDMLYQASSTSGIKGSVDRTVIESLRQLGDHEHNILSELIGIFVSEAAARLQEIYIAAASEDKESLADALHKLRGSALTLGAARLASVLQRLELEMHDDSQLDLDGSLSELRSELEQAITALKTLL